MIIDGPCKPLNPGENDTVRIVMNVLEADELRDEIAGVLLPKHTGLASLLSGLDMVKRHQLDNELNEKVAKILRMHTQMDATTSDVHVAAAIIREIDAFREKARVVVRVSTGRT